MKPKTMILMGVAITCGLGASYMTSRLLAERSGGEAEKVSVLVAKRNLNMGEQLKAPDDLFEPKEFLRGSEPRGAIDTPETLKNRVLKRSLRQGDHVTNEDMFGDKENGNSVYVNLPPGFRAIGIRVNAEEIAGGFASLPLSRVDIISTVRRSDDKSTYSQVLLEDVLVVAADANSTRNEQGQAMLASVVTVAVKPEDAMKLRLAGSMGQLSLLLRKMGDNSKVAEPIITAEVLKGGTRIDAGGEIESAGAEATVAVPKKAPEAVAKKAEPTTPPAAEQPKPAPVAVAKAPEPLGRRHVLVVREGENTKQTEYLVDDRYEVVTPDVQRSELTPPARTPRRGPATPPPAPPAAGEDEVEN